MPRNGLGTFNRVYNWVTDLGNSVAVTASRMDAEQDGIATALSESIARDGQTTITANIPFNSKKITGLGNGTARTDSIALGQVQDGTYTTLGTAGGSADAYTATPSPAIERYATGSRYIIKIQADNTTTSTLNVNAVGAKTLKKYDGTGAKLNLVAGDLQLDQYYDIFYDGTDFVVFSLYKTRGQTIQVVNTQTGAVATGTTTIPNDDTIPQITEGDEYMTRAITPTNASNQLRIDVVAHIAESTANSTTCVALFQDSTAGALGCGFEFDNATSAALNIKTTHFMTAGTTSATTFRVRAGSNQAGTITFNGFSGARKYGGVISSSITITEIQV